MSLVGFLPHAGHAGDGDIDQREHVEACVADLLAHWKPATARRSYRALRSFVGLLVDEGEIAESPMAPNAGGPRSGIDGGRDGPPTTQRADARPPRERTSNRSRCVSIL